MSLLPIGGGTLNVSGSGTASSVTAFVCNAKTKAHGEYTSYSFNSLATVGGVHYGCTAAGVFALSGDTDAGTAIDAAALTGILDFSTEYSATAGERQKRMESVILNARLETTRLAVRVKIDEATERLYVPTAAVSYKGLFPLRTKPGKGLKGRNWQVGFENVTGGDFVIAAMEATPVILSRRVQG